MAPDPDQNYFNSDLRHCQNSSISQNRSRLLTRIRHTALSIHKIRKENENCCVTVTFSTTSVIFVIYARLMLDHEHDSKSNTSERMKKNLHEYSAILAA